MAFYRTAFGLEESHRLDFPTFTLLYLRDRDGGFEIELTLNKSNTEGYTHGSGYGHMAFCVPDLAAHQSLLRGLGYPAGDLKELVSPGGPIRFFFTADPDGYKIEVLEMGGHYR